MSERVFWAPGRVEISGNHTDHQRGRVLAAAIDLNATCIASVNRTDYAVIESDGFGETVVDLSDLAPRRHEIGTTAALIRGVAAWFSGNGYPFGGFDGHVTSDIPVGMGLSSSAAFEVLIGNVIKGLFNADISNLEIALAGQFAENMYFGKPCGLMDQTSSSFGGMSQIDFFDPLRPIVKPISANLEGFSICVVASGDSHEDLTDEYAAIPAEMKLIASYFGKPDLRAVAREEFNASIGKLRSLGDRAILRAMHFFEENERVLRQSSALETDNIPEFMRLLTESGRSSLGYLQNLYSLANPSRQGLTLALALCEQILRGDGAYRVHGGGFAGTLLAIVPDGMKDSFIDQMSYIFGNGCCRFLKIQREGGHELVMGSDNHEQE